MVQNMFYFIFILCIFCTLVCGHGEHVHSVQYNSDNFVMELSKKNHFIMFYAPWCGHCQRLSPTWEQLAEMLNEDDNNIKVAKVDCTIDSKVCTEQDVTGYPTLKFFKVGENKGVKFRGTRDLPSLTTFINEQLRSGDENVPVDKNSKMVNGLTELNDETFNEHIKSSKHFVKFYAPWCGHCQKLAPIWEKLAQSLKFEESVSISKIDCTQFRSVCNKYEIKGYPTLLWIEDTKKIDKYQGQRTYEDLKTYVNKMMGASEELNLSEKKVQSISDSPVEAFSGANNFQERIENGITFIKFFAPWCGHCKRLAPAWEELGKKFNSNSNINIIKVDCTLDANKQLCNDEKVDGFPSLYLYKNGKKISEYNGDRSLEDLNDFVIKHSSHDEL